MGENKVIHFTRAQGQELGTGTAVDLLLSSSMPRIHHSGPCESCGPNANDNGVLLSCLDCFLSGYPLYLFKYGESAAIFLAKARGGTCSLASSDTPEVVLHRARCLLGRGFGCYDIFKNNCEDFAAYCKTGLLIMHGNTIGSSGQAISVLGAPVAAVCSSVLKLFMGAPLGTLVPTAGMYCMSRYCADLGNRKDVVKVAVEDLVAREDLAARFRVVPVGIAQDLINKPS